MKVKSLTLKVKSLTLALAFRVKAVINITDSVIKSVKGFSEIVEQDMKNGNIGGAGNSSQPKHDSNRKSTTSVSYLQLRMSTFLFISIGFVVVR